jgi:hypothetical protein
MEEKMKEADDEKSKSPLQEKLEKLTEKITQVRIYLYLRITLYERYV